MKKLIITVAASAACLALCAAVWLQNEPAVETICVAYFARRNRRTARSSGVARN